MMRWELGSLGSLGSRLEIPSHPEASHLEHPPHLPDPGVGPNFGIHMEVASFVNLHVVMTLDSLTRRVQRFHTFVYICFIQMVLMVLLLGEQTSNNHMRGLSPE